MKKNRVKQAIKDLSWISANMSIAKMPDEAGKLLDAAMLLDEIASQPMNGIPTQRSWIFCGALKVKSGQSFTTLMALFVRTKRLGNWSGANDQ